MPKPVRFEINTRGVSLARRSPVNGSAAVVLWESGKRIAFSKAATAAVFSKSWLLTNQTVAHPLRLASSTSGVRDECVAGEKAKHEQIKGLHQLWNRLSFSMVCPLEKITKLPVPSITNSSRVLFDRRDHGQQQHWLFHEFKLVDRLHGALHGGFASRLHGDNKRQAVLRHMRFLDDRIDIDVFLADGLRH